MKCVKLPVHTEPAWILLPEVSHCKRRPYIYWTMMMMMISQKLSNVIRHYVFTIKQTLVAINYHDIQEYVIDIISAYLLLCLSI